MCRSIWMRILSKRRFAALCSLLVLPVLLVSSCAETKHEKKTTNPWSAVKGYNLSSVAWSPRGDHIAFVAASHKDDTDDGLLRASIWVMSVPEQGQTVKLRRLATLTRKQGIPVALFWLDNKRIGWAASLYSETMPAYTFMQIGLRDGKPQRLVSQNFKGVQSRLAMESGFDGPDDVYYDTDSRSLIFSGGLVPIGVYIRILPLSTGKVRNLSVHHPEGLVYPKGYVSAVTLCGSLRNPEKPEFYIAANIMTETTGEWQIWRSNSYSLKQDKILAISLERYLLFPRTSPDGTLLAYLESRGSGKPDDVVLYDMKSGKHRAVVTISPGWEGAQPVLGCPYSWSPDGKMIAYADGSKVKKVRMAIEAGPSKKLTPL